MEKTIIRNTRDVQHTRSREQVQQRRDSREVSNRVLRTDLDKGQRTIHRRWRHHSRWS